MLNSVLPVAAFTRLMPSYIKWLYFSAPIRHNCGGCVLVVENVVNTVMRGTVESTL